MYLLNSKRLLGIYLLIAGLVGACGDDTVSITVTPANTGFTPNTNGFQFANYGTATDGVLQAEEMVRLFGDQVCAHKANGSCTLLPAAEMWMNKVNASMEGGRCEGMAVLSQLFYLGLLDPNDFGASTTYGLSLEGNSKLQRELAYWYSTQWLQDVLDPNTRILDAVESTQFLAGEYAKNDFDMYRIGMVYIDQSGVPRGGHAITAYGVDSSKNDNHARILVYDNNHPGEERYIDIDLSANSWEYSAATSPEEDTVVFSGSPKNNNKLMLTPTTPRLEAHACPFCIDEEGGTGSAGSPARQEIHFDRCRVLVQDPAGNKLGYTDAGLVNEIPDSRIMPLFSVNRFWKDDVPATLLAPVDTEISAAIKGMMSSPACNPGSITSLGPGYGAGTQCMPLETGDEDQVVIGPKGNSIAYTTATPGNGKVFLSSSSTTGIYRLTIDVRDQSQGLSISLEQSKPTAPIRVAVEYPEPVEILVLLERFSSVGTEVFSGLVPSNGRDVFLVDYLGWDGDSGQLPVGVDANHDGQAETTLMAMACEGDECTGFHETDEQGRCVNYGCIAPELYLPSPDESVIDLTGGCSIVKSPGTGLNALSIAYLMGLGIVLIFLWRGLVSPLFRKRRT